MAIAIDKEGAQQTGEKAAQVACGLIVLSFLVQ